MSPEEELKALAQKRVGTVLRGKYRVDGILGVGGMAVVYKVTHRNQAEFALKMLHPQLSIRDDVRTRFLREGYAANSVKHPGAVLVVDDDVAEDGAAFLVMELLDGAPAEEIWERCKRRMPLPAVASLAHQLLDVLAAAHAKNVVHRDIKPANVFVTREGTAKVLDFGIARLRDAVNASGATQTGMMMGTPGFMPPEQAMGKVSEIDGQADVWSAGATIFTLLGGLLVHEQGDGDTPQQLMIRAATQPARSLSSVAPNVPPPIARVVDVALAFEKAARWPSTASMRDALRDAYAQAFGAPPSREALANAFAGTVEPTMRGNVLELPAQKLLASGTPQPVQMPGTSIPDEEPVSIPGTRRGALVPILVAFVLAAGIGGASAFTLVGKRTDPTAASASPPVAAAVAPLPAAPSASASSAPAVASATVSPATAGPSSKPWVPPAPATTRGGGTTPIPSAKPTPSASPAPAPSPPVKPGCDPPYTLDAQGNKHFKLECY